MPGALLAGCLCPRARVLLRHTTTATDHPRGIAIPPFHCRPALSCPLVASSLLPRPCRAHTEGPLLCCTRRFDGGLPLRCPIAPRIQRRRTLGLLLCLAPCSALLSLPHLVLLWRGGCASRHTTTTPRAAGLLRALLLCSLSLHHLSALHDDPPHAGVRVGSLGWALSVALHTPRGGRAGVRGPRRVP